MRIAQLCQKMLLSALLFMVCSLQLQFVLPLHADDLRKSASWEWPDAAIYEAQFLSYLDQHQANEAARKQVTQFWSDTSEEIRGPQLLARLLETAGLIEPRIDELTKQLNDPLFQPIHPRDIDWLTSDVPGWMQDTIRLACGRAFAQRRMYDEALETLSGLETIQVCDPASLIFYRATCQHHLLKAKECLASVELLLEREDELPVRFVQLANLMQADIENLEENSLDEVSRLMRDVERRLDLGRAGTRVRDEEKEIVDKLDKMIERIEEQIQQQQQLSPGSQQQPSQLKPMDDSRAAGGSGPGDVDQKDNGKRASWGNLPPAQRQESLQRLTEELPSHYRDVIEGYFRQLAKERK